MRRVAALARNEARLLAHDPSAAAFVVMPIIAAFFTKPVFQPFLVHEGYRGANGSEQVLPAMFVTSAFFLVGYQALAFFREHGWGTWERLRASAATSREILVGKSLVPVAMLAFSFAVMFGVLGVLFHLEVRGSLFALALIGALVGVCALTFGIMMVALCRTFTQVNAVVQVVALGSAFFGGALVPIAALPHWARVVGALTPAYWGMQGLQKVILDGAAIGDVLSSAAVLVAFTIVFAVVIAVRLRFEETKTAWF